MCYIYLLDLRDGFLRSSVGVVFVRGAGVVLGETVFDLFVGSTKLLVDAEWPEAACEISDPVISGDLISVLSSIGEKVGGSGVVGFYLKKNVKSNMYKCKR